MLSALGTVVLDRMEINLPICCIHPAVKASSVNLFADARARCLISMVSCRERESALANFEAYSEAVLA